MKLKIILACAVGAGLLTLGAGSARATVDEISTVVNAQLIVKYTDNNGKTKSATVTSKDLVTAIGEDQGEDFSGDEIVYFENDYYLADKHGDLGENLTEDDVLDFSFTELTSSKHEGAHGSFTDSATGVCDFEFFSNGDDGGFLDEENNELSFEDEDAPYTGTETGAATTHNGKEKITISEKIGIATDGFDFDVFDNGDTPLPIFGTITFSGSGTITPI
jgi:hypothetical protein